MHKPVLLLWSRGARALIDDTIAERFEIIAAWEHGDPEAIIGARGHEVEVTLTTRLDAAQLARLPRLSLIVVPGAGYEHIDVAAAHARGIIVTNAGDAHSGDVADHAVALTLASLHRLSEADAWVRDGHWAGGSLPGRRRGLSGERFGIAGLGHIGSAIAERLAPFGGEIAWWSRSAKPAQWRRCATLLDLADWCSVLIVATRGDAIGLIDRSVIDAVGPEGLIVNIARGAVIQEDALIEALRSGRLGRAALDVFADEPTGSSRWRDLPNTILTPHIGGVSGQALAQLRAAATRNLRSFLDGDRPVNPIQA